MVTQEKTGKSPCNTPKKATVERDGQDADLDQRAERRDQECCLTFYDLWHIAAAIEHAESIQEELYPKNEK